MGSEFTLIKAQKKPAGIRKAINISWLLTIKPYRQSKVRPAIPTRITRLRPKRVAIKPLGRAKITNIKASPDVRIAILPASMPRINLPKDEIQVSRALKPKNQHRIASKINTPERSDAFRTSLRWLTKPPC